MPNPDASLSARRAMIVSQLRPSGVNDKRVLEAFATVPREDFLPEAQSGVAYRDRSIDLGEEGHAMAPTPLAKLIDRADPQSRETALVVGPNAGYAAALLTHMGLKVFKADSATAAQGDEAGAPYDLMLILGAIEQVPEALLSRLADDGRIAAPVADGTVARLAIGSKSGDTVSFRNFDDAQVAPLPGFAAAKGFSF